MQTASGANAGGRVIFLVHMLPRFVSDFGAVARYLISNRIPTTIYSSPTASDSAAGWAEPAIAARFRAALPPAADLRPLPLDRERLTFIGLIRAGLLALSLAWRAPGAVFVLWTIIPNLVCGLPLRLLQRRCVFLVTGLGSVFDSTTITGRLLRAFVTRAYAFVLSGRHSRVIVHNHEDKAFLRGLGVEASHIVVTPGCGVDPEEYPFLPKRPSSSKKVILVPVRLLREKGVLDAAQASNLLRERGIEHEMWFSSSVDPGNPSSLTPDDISQVQRNSPSTRFVGFQSSVVPLYEASDVVCIPTCYREGLPTAILEAAACGRPMVATDNVGCREFIEDGKTGLEVPCGSPAALAAALARLLTDMSLADRLRRNAHEKYLSGFTKLDMLAITVDVMRDLDLQVPRPQTEGR